MSVINFKGGNKLFSIIMRFTHDVADKILSHFIGSYDGHESVLHKRK